MKKVFFSILAAMIVMTVAFTGCKSKTGPKPEEEQTQAKPASGTGKASAGEASHIRLEDDYYDFVNGQMLDNTKIPGDASGWSQFYKLDREAYEILNDRRSLSDRYGYGGEKGCRIWRTCCLYGRDQPCLHHRGISGTGGKNLQ